MSRCIPCGPELGELTTKDGRKVKLKIPGMLPPRMKPVATEERGAEEPPRDNPRRRTTRCTGCSRQRTRRQPRACEHTFVTSQGSAYARFQRALHTGRASIAWSAATELEHIDLQDALALVLLVVDDPRFARAAARAGWAACASRRPCRCVRRSCSP